MPRKIDPGTIQIGAGSSSSQDSSVIGGVSASFTSHVTSTYGAHTSSAIFVDERPPLYNSRDVNGVLDELSALIPPRPATLGNYRQGVGDPGITDWGVLKLNDAPFDARAGVASWNIDPAETFGYYHTPPTPKTSATAFSAMGEDEITDSVFNIYHVKFAGAGPGVSHAGAFTRDVGGPNPLTQTLRIVPSSGPTGGKSVVVSGVLYPADRGVLALLHWPSAGDTNDFLAQTLNERCLAAILLGNGVSSGQDGTPGGIFAFGTDGTGYDPFAFPGQASGQYDLEELQTGLATVGGGALPLVADPAAGQVRLGVDSYAGAVVTNGITILGGGNSSPGGGSVPLGDPDKDSSEANFFRYRLPYLADYSDSYSGLPYTPAAEKPRFYAIPSFCWSVSDLSQAGNLTNFPKDYWTFQVARYRHYFQMDDTVLGAGSPRDNGSYILLHFKTEAAFEALVRDGVTPADTDLYSTNLVDWSNPEAPGNIAVNDPGNSYPQSSGYHILRSSVYEDPAGITDPTVTLATYKLENAGADWGCWVSGVNYFSPATSFGGASSPIVLTDIAFSATDFFTNSFHTKQPGESAGDAYLGNLNPAVLNLAPFSYQMDAGVPTMVPDFTTQVLARQRLEFGYEELGAFSITDGPLPADTVSFSTAGEISMLGDPDDPGFTTDARMTLFLRRPMGHEDLVTSALPYPSTAVSELSGSSILFHSTAGGVYGNIGVGAPVSVAVATTQTAERDVSERFLDEVYRYRSDWATSGESGANAARLNGPGLIGGASAIDVNVRAGTAAGPWDTASFFQQGIYVSDLSAMVDAQVAGLPYRAPALDYPLLSPFPSRGILLYPKDNYSIGYRPSFAAGDLTAPQVDYSACAGDRIWQRALDASFAASASPEAVVGATSFKLKIWGLELADFAYNVLTAPGSGAIAIMTKVPGLTNWMDIGRTDGDGVSKQDVGADGSGCLVAGANTFNGVDADSGLVYSQVEISTGAAAPLFASFGFVAVLIKVIIKDAAAGKALDFTQTTSDGDPGLLRGLVGLEIVRP